jgi:glutathione S-transferase
MSNIITLYDIVGGPARGTPFSPNTWKTRQARPQYFIDIIFIDISLARYSLNYKGLPYKVEWVDVADIEALCKRIGAKPTTVKSDGSPSYTLPVIHDPTTDTAVSESAAIAEYLDRAYPSTPILFPTGTFALQHAFIDACSTAIRPGFGPFVNEWFTKAKETRLGLEPGEPNPLWLNREDNWGKVRGGFNTLNGWLEKNKSAGMFVMGDALSFADIVLVSHIDFIKRVVGEDSKEWEDLKNCHGGRWDSFVNSFEKYATVV